MKKKKFTTKVLAEVAIFAALAFALDALQGGIFRGVFASGGSIGFAMVPILLISYRRGLFPGILCGLIVSLVQMLGGIYVINATNFDSDFMKILGPFLQIMLDYILAYTVVGFAGLFTKLYKKSNNKFLWILVGSIIAGLLKYSCHILAGGLFWLNQGSSFLNINDTSWLYSFIYNGAYSIPNVIICTVIMVIIAKFYPKFIDVDEDVKLIEEKKINEEK